MTAEYPNRTTAPRVIVIDNFDSFVYNLVQYLGELGAEPDVRRQDAITSETIVAESPDAILVSPGPGHPDDAGVSLDLFKPGKRLPPTIGVCLGHQCIGLAYGAQVVRADAIMHGKTSEIHHDDTGIFEGLPNPLAATRYHSLVVERDSIPDELVVNAWTADGTVMGLRHRELPIHGVQFHPESILTDAGHDMLRNFLRLVGSHVPQP